MSVFHRLCLILWLCWMPWRWFFRIQSGTTSPWIDSSWRSQGPRRSRARVLSGELTPVLRESWWSRHSDDEGSACHVSGHLLEGICHPGCWSLLWNIGCEVNLRRLGLDKPPHLICYWLFLWMNNFHYWPKTQWLQTTLYYLSDLIWM